MSWPECKIGDLCKVGRGSSPRPKHDQRYFEGGDIPWIKVADATASGKYLFETKEHVNSFGASFSRLLPVGSLIICTSGTLGLAVFLGVEGCIHDGWLYTYDYKGLDLEFFYYFLETRKTYFKSLAYGAAIQNINTGILRNTPIRLPPIDQQIRIAEILKAYDDLMENNRRRMALLESAARQLYHEWFVRLRFPGHEHSRITNGVPEGWENLKAYSAMEVLSGGTPKTNVPEYWGGEISFYTPKDASDTAYVLQTERTITELGLKNCNSRLYEQNTVFISARGTVGKLNLASRPMAMSQSCYALIGKGQVSQLFLYCALKEAIEHFKQHAVGAVFDAIIVDTFKMIPFTVPADRMVRLFEDAAAPMFRQVANLMEQQEKLRAARSMLLPRLISGEIAL
jgi:type I restriction enzyme S subunit